MTDTFQLPHKTGPILLLDRTHDLTGQDVLYSFALDELLCRQTGRGGPAICHLWRHPRAFVMGVRDSRLPGAEAALQRLQELGYDTVVRHSGGAAVPLDPGIVNLSLILPVGPERKELDFHPDFEIMVELIRNALRDTGQSVNTGEIEGAFCPGTYDLSIGGQKFCGIAQRRQNKAFIVQAFIIAEGSGAERAALVRSFYDEAGEGAKPGEYPHVHPSSTASLEELADLRPDGSALFTKSVKDVIRKVQASADPALLAEAASRLEMPGEDAVRDMADSLRQRYVKK